MGRQGGARESRAPGWLALAWALGGAFLTPPAAAQSRFGQWTWDAVLAADKRAYDNKVDSALAGSYDEGTLGVDFGVNGFILHPSFLEFRAEVDLQVTNFNAGSARDTFRWGARGDFRYRPRGGFPVSLYFGRQAYSYESVTAGDPLDVASLPETVSSLGGRLRVRRGFLSGLLAGYDGNRLDYVEPAAKTGNTQLAFLDWSRSSRSFQPSARLDWQSNDYGLVDYGIRTLTGRYNHWYQPHDSLRWQMSAWGIHQALDFQDAESATDTLRMTQVVQRYGAGGPPSGDLFEVRYDGGIVLAGDELQTHRVGVRKQWRIGRALYVAPLAGYLVELGGGRTVQAPEGGVQATWQGRRGRFDLQASGSAGLRATTPGSLSDGTDTNLVADASAVVGHGSPDRLREELTVAWGLNRLDVSGQPVAELPGVVTGVGTQDGLRARLELRRNWRGVQGMIYGEHQRNEPTGTFADRVASLRSTTGTAQLVGRRFSLTANLGDTRAGGATDQYARFVALSGTVRPLRLVSVYGSWRSDRRELTNAPTVDADRIELGADLLVGAFVVRGFWYDTTESALTGETRKHEGFQVTLARRFAGWLPIVTEAFSRGQVR